MYDQIKCNMQSPESAALEFIWLKLSGPCFFSKFFNLWKQQKRKQKELYNLE